MNPAHARNPCPAAIRRERRYSQIGLQNVAIVQLWPISGGEPWQGSDGGLHALEAGRHYSRPPAVGHAATKHNLIASLPTAVIAPWDQLRPCSVTDGRAVIMRQSPCRCYASRCDGAAQEGDGPTPSWPSAISTSAHCALASHHRHGHQSAGQPAPSVTSELSEREHPGRSPLAGPLTRGSASVLR